MPEKGVCPCRFRAARSAAIAGPDRPTPYKDETLYRSSLFPSIVIPVLGPLLGMAARALEYVIGKSPGERDCSDHRSAPILIDRISSEVGNASVLIETAHLQAFSAADIIDGAARDGRALSAVEQGRLRLSAAYAAQSLVKSVDLLMYAHGSSSFWEQNPLQRIWRDIGMAARHASLLPAIAAEVYGRALFGIEEMAVRVH
jgi:3-hydroxy-9,10-secoandrosta-1,3,5(10)-triene-9,17-dione monooxygenase